MKSLPIVFGIDVKDDFPIFFGSFYKFAYYCNENNWPILAQEKYYVDPKYYEKKYDINLIQVATINEIPKISKNMFSNIDKYTITTEETNSIIEEYSDIDNAWIKMMNTPNNKLVKLLSLKIMDILKQHPDLKNIIVWRHNESISQVAKKYNLTVIEMELSGVRKPNYNFGLSYFQFSNKYSEKEFNKRYENYQKEIKLKEFPYLTRKELVSLLISKKEINNIVEEEYDVGVALGLRNDYETLSTNSITNENILKDLRGFESKNDILIRKHPANYNYNYKYENLYTLDNSVSSIQFVSKCKKIISSVSNIALEAMILGKTSYTLGKMPFVKFCYNNLNYNDEFVISIEDLNFLIFSYYVPYELALSEEYINFRNTNPSEHDIYMYHYNYILSKYSYSKKNITIFSSRKKFLKNKKEIELKETEINNVNVEKNKIQYERDYYKEQINQILNSKSWELTKPLRTITKLFRKK